MKQTDNFDIGAPVWSTTQERNRDKLHSWCDLAAGMEAVRGQWKASILVALSGAPSAVPQLLERLSPINRRVLVRALRELEAEVLISRTDILYCLTNDGVSLVDILHKLVEWQKNRA